MSQAPNTPERIEVRVDAAKEIREISLDFLNPIEILREATANAYDAGAQVLTLRATPDKDISGRRILTLESTDDGVGMDQPAIEAFFGLGLSEKPKIPGRTPLGFKGHGTKIYYSAQELWVVTRREGSDLIVAWADKAREHVLQGRLPEVLFLRGKEAEEYAQNRRLTIPSPSGTTLRLIDYTPDSGRLIDDFKRSAVENYLRWFTVYGSFEHVVRATSPKPPMDVRLQATDDSTTKQVLYGHPWPVADRTDLKALRELDPRRPYNYFCKSFRKVDLVISGGYRIDIAVAFEGKQGRLDRDPLIRRQKTGGLYFEEDRYGLWLCRDHIPIELKTDWLQDTELPVFEFLEPRRALVLVNCNDFFLTANRGSVGNSQATLLQAVRDGVIEFLSGLEDDDDLARFREEYEEERLRRVRDKDRKAFLRRLDRYNRKKHCTIALPDGSEFRFFEPQREITLFGLIAQLQVKDPTLLDLDILDYDDHQGIDLLVRRGHDPSDLLERDKVAYVELKYELRSNINHAFDNLHAIICWETYIKPGFPVTDAADQTFTLTESTTGAVTYSTLAPKPDSKLSHQIRVVVLKRLLQETRKYRDAKNPRHINGRRAG